MGNSTINGHFQQLFWHNQRVIIYLKIPLVPWFHLFEIVLMWESQYTSFSEGSWCPWYRWWKRLMKLLSWKCGMVQCFTWWFHFANIDEITSHSCYESLVSHATKLCGASCRSDDFAGRPRSWRDDGAEGQKLIDELSNPPFVATNIGVCRS
jgi:hypothetical protein